MSFILFLEWVIFRGGKDTYSERAQCVREKALREAYEVGCAEALDEFAATARGPR